MVLPSSFGSVVTEAELTPTEPLPERKITATVAASAGRSARRVSFLPMKPQRNKSLGDSEIPDAKRGLYMRCGYVCGGIAGLDKSGKWSNWYASRYRIPDGRDLPRAMERAMPAYQKRTLNDHLFYISFRPGYSLDYSCSHCQLVCHPDPNVRKKRYRMIMSSGVVVQNADGSYCAVSPEEAKRRLATMEPDRRRLYEPGNPPEK